MNKNPTFFGFDRFDTPEHYDVPQDDTTQFDVLGSFDILPYLDWSESRSYLPQPFTAVDFPVADRYAAVPERFMASDRFERFAPTYEEIPPYVVSESEYPFTQQHQSPPPNVAHLNQRPVHDAYAPQLVGRFQEQLDIHDPLHTYQDTPLQMQLPGAGASELFATDHQLQVVFPEYLFDVPAPTIDHLPVSEHFIKTPRRRTKGKSEVRTRRPLRPGLIPLSSLVPTLVSVSALSLDSVMDSALSLASPSTPTPTFTPPYKATPSYDGLAEPQGYTLVRGIAAGGASTRPPNNAATGCHYVPAELRMHGALVADVCRQWSEAECADRRRIIRIERTQHGAQVEAHFLVVGLAAENPETLPAPAGVDVVEVSCLEGTGEDGPELNYYITLVEVVSIVEALIGTTDMDLMLRRRERGRIRLNLMPFWLKNSVSSKRAAEDDYGHVADARAEFARRIMAYEIRKPRGFDKGVRVLQWERLAPALLRALQCYYAEIPDSA